MVESFFLGSFLELLGQLHALDDLHLRLVPESGLAEPHVLEEMPELAQEEGHAFILPRTEEPQVHELSRFQVDGLRRILNVHGFKMMQVKTHHNHGDGRISYNAE